MHAGFPGVNTEFQELVKACAEAALETNDSKLKTKVGHRAFVVCLFLPIHAAFPFCLLLPNLLCTCTGSGGKGCSPSHMAPGQEYCMHQSLVVLA